MKLAAYAKLLGISYLTAWRMWKRGEIPGYQLSTGTVIVNQPDQSGTPARKLAIYARASKHEYKKNLETQAERLVSWCNAHGWSVAQIIKECGSDINDQRPISGSVR